MRHVELLLLTLLRWAARPQILFTDTIPVARVDAARILIVDDIVSSHASNQDDPATEELLTDGCGLMCELNADRLLDTLLTGQRKSWQAGFTKPSSG